MIFMDNINIYLEKLKSNYGFNFCCNLINKFADVFSEITLKKNDVLIRIGDKINCIFFVVVGILRDYYIDDGGNDITRFSLMKEVYAAEKRLFPMNRRQYVPRRWKIAFYYAVIFPI